MSSSLPSTDLILLLNEIFETFDKLTLKMRVHKVETVGDAYVAVSGLPWTKSASIGEVTSAMRSPVLKKNIALCRINTIHSETGTEVEVGKLDGHQKRIPAVVVPFPFYDPEKKRVRG